MALVIHVKKGQQLIVNGAVLENASGRTITMLLKNEAAVLRAEDILTPDSTQTPAGMTYYALQCLYLFPEHRQQHLQHFNQLIDSYVGAAPSARSLADEIKRLVDTEQYYAALKTARKLIRHEGEVLSYVHQQLAERVRSGATCGESESERGLGIQPGSVAPKAKPGSE